MNRPVLFVVKGLDLGGVERIVTDLATGLYRRGEPVEVALVNPQRNQLVATLEAAGVTVHPLGGSDRVGLRALWRLWRLGRRLQPRVVHAHGLLPAVASALTLRRVPLVASLHTTWGAMRRPSRVAFTASLPRRALVIAVSAAVRSSLPTRLAERTEVIGHGVDLAACDAAVAARVARPPDHDGTVEVLTVASHRAVKNYENLLRAVAAARRAGHPIRLRAIGEGPRLGRHQQLCDDLGLTAHVIFEPPRHDVLAAIAAADVFVLASDLEGQPLVLLEAMGCGRPVVATAVGRAPELISPAAGRLVPPGDWQALATALGELCDPAVRQGMGAAARQVAADCTLDRAIEEHLVLYRRAAP